MELVSVYLFFFNNPGFQAKFYLMLYSFIRLNSKTNKPNFLLVAVLLGRRPLLQGESAFKDIPSHQSQQTLYAKK